MCAGFEKGWLCAARNLSRRGTASTSPRTRRGRNQINHMQLNSYWKWKCEGCGFEFILILLLIPEACHRCGGEWFLKIGEAATKVHRRD
jgi:hypothetical protein